MSSPSDREKAERETADRETADRETAIRAGYAAYLDGDIDSLLAIFEPDFEWTFLDPSQPDPEPQLCHGREQLRRGLQRQIDQGLRPAIEEVTANGDQVLVVIRTPGLDRFRARAADDRSYEVLTFRHGQVIALRACRTRAEARAAAGLG